MTDKDYSDIIDLPHPVSARHPQMSRSDRAGQFAPFAALTGYDDEVSETAAKALEKNMSSVTREAFDEDC